MKKPAPTGWRHEYAHRDSQRRKVYNAEEAVCNRPAPMDIIKTNDRSSLRDLHYRVLVGDYAERIKTTFRVDLGDPLVELKFSRSRNRSWAHSHEITLGLSSFQRCSELLRVYLHELSHVIDARDEGRLHPVDHIQQTYDDKSERWIHPGELPYRAGHGPIYCGIHLRLVLMFHGERHRRDLAASYIKHGVRVEHWS